MIDVDLGTTSKLCEYARSRPLPLFFIDLSIVAQRVKKLVHAWDVYSFPVKAQPHPAVLETAAKAGAHFDICSECEFDLVLRTGIFGEKVSFTSPILPPGLCSRLVEFGARVFLDSLGQVDFWCANHAGIPAGLRLQVKRTEYGGKFGVSLDSLPTALARLDAFGCELSGLHAHAPMMDGQFPAVDALVATLERVPIPSSLRISLGGGWPHHRGWREDRDESPELHNEASRRIAHPLAERGCKTEIAIEPGEAVIGPAGWLLSRVHAVKDLKNHRVVILESPWVVNPKYTDYPVTVHFEDGGHFRLRLEDQRPTCIFGAANSPADPINLHQELGLPQPGDFALVHHCGAYVSSLISAFNGRVPPATEGCQL